MRLKSKSGREEDYKQQTIQLAAHIRHCAITEEQGNALFLPFITGPN